MSLSGRLIDGVNAISSPWAEAMWRASWQGGLALLAAWGICELLSKKSGRAQSWFWRMGYGKFLLCVACLTPVSLPLLQPRSPAPEGQRLESAVSLDIEREITAEQSFSPTQTVLPETQTEHVTAFPKLAVPEMQHAGTPAFASPATHVSLESWLLFIWFAGVGLCFLRLARAWRETQTMRKKALAVNESITVLACQRLASRIGAGHSPEILISDSLHSPLLVGIRKPAIVLPGLLAANCGREELELILAHELAHLRRRDLAWNLLQSAVSVLFFFHPLVWLTRRPWMLAQELACDEMALAVTGARAAELGQLLLRVVTYQKGERRQLLGVGVAESRGTVRRRLLAMKEGLGWSRKRVAGVAALAGVLGVIGLVPWRVIAREPQAGVPSIAPTVAHDGGSQDASDASGKLFDLEAVMLPSFGGLKPGVSMRPTGINSPDASNNQDSQNRERPLPSGTAEDIATRAPARQNPSTISSANPIFVNGLVSASITAISARSDGTLIDVAVKDGQTVKRGDVLFQFDQVDAQRAVNIAKARLMIAEAKLEQARVAMSTGTRKEVDVGGDVKQLEAMLLIERAELDAKTSELELLTLSSPTGGVAMLGDVKAGQYVSRGNLLGKIVDLSDLSVKANVPESAIDKVKVGQKIVFVSSPTEKYAGEITTISPIMDAASATVAIRAKLNEGAGKLRPGQNGNIIVSDNP